MTDRTECACGHLVTLHYWQPASEQTVCTVDECTCCIKDAMP